MGDPVTAGISMGMSAAGGLISGLGAKEAGQAQADTYRYKAGVAMLNKQVADQNAAWATQVGGIKGMESGMKSAQDIGETKVMQSASGLDVNGGSAAAVRKTQTDVAEFDQNVIAWDAAKQNYGYQVKGATDTAESKLDMTAADQSEKAGDLNMLTSFLNAGGSVASKWMQGKQAGMGITGA